MLNSGVHLKNVNDPLEINKKEYNEKLCLSVFYSNINFWLLFQFEGGWVYPSCTQSVIYFPWHHGQSGIRLCLQWSRQQSQLLCNQNRKSSKLIWESHFGGKTMFNFELIGELKSWVARHKKFKSNTQINFWQSHY